MMRCLQVPTNSFPATKLDVETESESQLTARCRLQHRAYATEQLNPCLLDSGLMGSGRTAPHTCRWHRSCTPEAPFLRLRMSLLVESGERILRVQAMAGLQHHEMHSPHVAACIGDPGARPPVWIWLEGSSLMRVMIRSTSMANPRSMRQRTYSYHDGAPLSKMVLYALHIDPGHQPC